MVIKKLIKLPIWSLDLRHFMIRGSVDLIDSNLQGQLGFKLPKSIDYVIWRLCLSQLISRADLICLNLQRQSGLN